MSNQLNKIQLFIVADNDTLARTLTAQACHAETSVTITTVSELPPASTHIDVAIACKTDDCLKTLRERFPSALIVWHAKATELDACPPGTEMDDLWVTPMSDAEIAHKYALLLKRCDHRKHYDFYQRAMHAAMNNLPDLVWIKDMEGTHLKVNDAFCDCANKTKDNVEGYGHYHIWDISEEEYKDSEYVCVDTDVIVKETKQPGVFDELVMSARGLRQFKTYKSPILDDLGDLLGTVGVARDVTDLQNIDNKLRIVLDSMPFALLVTDDHNTAIHTNPKFEKLFNVRSEDILGNPIDLSKITHVVSRNPIHNNTEEELIVRAGDPNSDDDDVIIVVQQADILDIFNNVAGKLTIYIDVTRSRKMDKKLKEMAYRDALTGLYTRHYLFHKLEKLPQYSGQAALLVLDLDNFKHANDTFGHLAGDRILKQTGTIMREAFPGSTVVRFGGDEFIVMHLGIIDQNAFIQKAQKLVQTLKTTYEQDPQAQKVSCSGGIAFSQPQDNEDFESLLRRSDKALYRAKDSGKNRVEVF